MPGFGSGPFGASPFGEWKWSRRVLFETIPEIYKQQDLTNGGYLELFADSLRPSFDQLRHNIRDMLDVRDPMLVRTQYDEVRRLRLGPVLGSRGAITQRGVTASVDGLQQFIAPTARFRTTDVGKTLSVSGSQFAQNNKTVTLVRVISPTIAFTDPILSVDAGSLRWELRTKVDPPTDRLTIQIRSGDISEITPDWLVFDGFSDFRVIARRQFRTALSEGQPLVEQEGADGGIDELGRFFAPSSAIDQLDVGKQITIANSSFPTNIGKYEILSVEEITPGDVRVVLSADPVLTTEPSGLVWALLPYGEIDVAGVTPPRGVVEQEGVDLLVTSSGVGDVTVSTATGSFSSADVGKELSMRGSTAVPPNDGIYIVLSAVSATSLLIAQRVGTPLIVDFTGTTWELRTATLVGDSTQVDARASSMIVDLAPDFGIDIDTQESESRQRSWLRNVTRWVDIKGHADSYRIIGAISGFNIQVFHLFRVAPSLFDLLPGSNEYELGEAGRTGNDGMLQVAGLRLQLQTPSGAFVSTDVGRNIHISNAATPANNKLYTIDSVVGSTVVEFDVTDIASLPDANNGSLTWSVVRLYTDLPPARPRFDEVNADLLGSIVDAASNGELTFRVDQYCWEDNFDATARIDVLSVSTITPGVHQISVTGTLEFPTSPEVVVGAGNWEFVSLSESDSGSGDLLTGAAPELTLVDGSASFSSDLVGHWVSLQGATTLANNGLFRIQAVSSSTTLTYFNGAGSGEAFPGTYLLYRESILFVDTVPTLIQFIAPGAVSGTGDSISLVGVGVDVRLTSAAGLFTIGMVGSHVRIINATTPGNIGIFLIKAVPSATQLEYENPLGAAEAFPGVWAVGLGVYTFLASSAIPPVLEGPAQLRYSCASVPSCDYCGSNKVLAVIEATDELLAEGNVQVERLFERVVSRLENEVKPAHVELIAYFRASAEATLLLSASVEPDI